MPEIPKLPPIADQPLSVVLLARNSGEHLNTVVISWLGTLDDIRPGAYELIVVDDASDDGTADKLAQLTSSYSAVRTIRLESRQGEGAALRAGLEAATNPLIFYTLCDPDYRPVFLSEMLAKTVQLEGGCPVKEIDHVQLMTGFRAGRPMPVFLRILGWGWRAFCWVVFGYTPQPLPGWLGMRRQFGGLLARVLFGVRHHDVACPVRLLRRDILPRIPIQSNGPFAHVEMLAKVNFLGHMMGEEMPLKVVPPPDRGDAGVFIRDGRKVFDKPDFGPAVLPGAGPSSAATSPASSPQSP